jgi:hypothetical protein
MDIISGISAATQAISIAKALRGIEKDYDAASYKSQITDLISSLADAKLALSDAKDQLADRDQEIARLKASFEDKASLKKGIGDYSYKTDENGNLYGYPVCPRCEAVDCRIVQTKEAGRSNAASCPVCSKVYHPVDCYLPAGSGFLTKQQQESSEWEAAMANSKSKNFYS